MALTDKLTAIANAIRGKTGGTKKLTLDEMVAAINSISGGGGGLPAGIAAAAFGEYAVASDFTTTRQTVTHNLGVVPDLVLFYYDGGNIATTYSMLFALRCTKFGYRSSAYNGYNAYHGNSTTTVSLANTNSTSVGVSNLTATTFQIASHSTSYYWRGGRTYKWLAIKFS